MEKLKILVVDNSVVYRRFISEAVNLSEYSIVKHATSDGNIALEWLEQSDIDVVLIDLQVILKDRNAILEQIIDKYPGMEIIIMCKNCSEHAEQILSCLNIGAFTFIEKPGEKEFEQSLPEVKNHLKDIFAQIKVKNYSKSTGSSDNPNTDGEMQAGTDNIKQISDNIVLPQGFNKKQLDGIDLVLIASSTGGPAALDTIFSKLPADFNKPTLIVQHMPPEFTRILAANLSRKYILNIKEADNGDVIKPGQIFVAPGGFHMIVKESVYKEETIELIDSPYVNGVRPAADVLFDSVADVYKRRNILVIILTGMGNDGVKGLRKIKENCNCYCISQSEESCVVYGMPKSVFEAGLSDEAADLDKIASRIYQISLERGVRK